MKIDDKLPGQGEFLWMLFMQPTRLRHRLQDCGIARPDASAWRLWRAGGMQRAYALRIFATLILTTPLFPVGLGLLLQAAGAGPEWFKLGLGVVAGMLFGLLRALLGRATLGLALGLVLGISVGLGYGTSTLVTVSELIGVPLGLALGLVAGGYRDVIVILSMLTGIELTVASLLGSFGEAIELSSTWLLAALLGLLVAVFCIRIPVYLMECFIEALLYFLQRLAGWKSLRWSPLLHHELIPLPLPFLASHIVLAAEADPDLTLRALEACTIAPGQRRSGRIALARLQSRELEACARAGAFGKVADWQTQWLPSLDEADPILLGFAELARHLQAAQTAGLADERRQQLEHGLETFHILECRLRAERSDLARELRSALTAWHSSLDKLLAETAPESG